MRILMVTAAFLIVSPTAQADVRIQTAGEMLRICQSTHTYSHNVCLGYIYGFVGGHAFAGELVHPELDGMLFCLPGSWTVGQGKAAFVRWAADNPDKHQLSPMYGMGFAFAQAFPCD